MLKYLPVAW